MTYVLSGEDNDHGAYLAAGMNCFNFELPLSEFLPSTFLGELGGTQYLSMVAVRYENSLGQLDQISNPRENANFNVIGISDLNMQPAQIRVNSYSHDLIIHCYIYIFIHKTERFHLCKCSCLLSCYALLCRTA